MLQPWSSSRPPSGPPRRPARPSRRSTLPASPSIWCSAAASYQPPWPSRLSSGAEAMRHNRSETGSALRSQHSYGRKALRPCTTHRGGLVPDEGWLTVAILAATLYTTLHSIEVAGWGERVVAAPPLGLLAVAVGLLAAKSSLRTPWAMLLGIAIGAEAVLLSQAVLSPGGSWAEKLGWLSHSLRPVFEAALYHAAGYDPLVFATLVAAIGYLLGLCSSWLVFRLQSGWWALVLIATAGLVHLSYATVDSIPPYLASLLLGALTVASLELHLRRSTWRAVGLPVQAASTTWTLTAACGLAGLALFVALQLPAGQINAELASRHQALTDPW